MGTSGFIVCQPEIWEILIWWLSEGGYSCGGWSPPCMVSVPTPGSQC